MKTKFQYDVTFLKQVTDAEANARQDYGKWVHEPCTKIAHFWDLDQTDRDQHGLHFDIMAFFTSGGDQGKARGKTKKVKFDNEGVYDLAVRFIEELLIVDENFNAKDKEEFLNDSKAMIKFSFWLLKEKALPFFQVLMDN